MSWALGRLLAAASLLGAGAAIGEPLYPRPELSRPARGVEVWQLLEVDDSGVAGFVLPDDWDGDRIILHVEEAAGDVSARLNGIDLVPAASAGFDLSEALALDGEQRLEVEGGGSWWIEPVPDSRVLDAYCVPDIDTGSVMVHIDAELISTALMRVGVLDDRNREVASANLGLTYGGADSGLAQSVSTALKLPLPNAHLWAPDTPYLYGLRIELKHDGEIVDSIESLFGMRKIAVAGQSVNLNREPVYLPGIDLMASANPSSETIKGMGFDLVRVRGGMVPGRFYHDCDRLGLLVWQEFAAGDGREMRATVESLRRHPSVIAWEPKPQVVSVHRWLRRIDSSRLTVGGKLGDVAVGGKEAHQVTLAAVASEADLEACKGALSKVGRDGGGYLLQLEGTFAEGEFEALRALNEKSSGR